MDSALQEQGSMFQSAGDNSMKIWKMISFAILSLVFLGVIFIFEIKDWPAGSSIAGIVL